MKKTAIAMLTLAAGILAASCQKEAEPEVKSFEPMTINAVSEGIGTATKTEMAYKYDILWSEDDQIYVTDGTANDTFTLSSGEGTTKGTFTQDGTASFTSEVKAYYPATMVQDGGLVWPATQTNNQTVPMYSTKTVSGNVEDFNFSSLGSVLQIVFNSKQENVTLRSIEIKDGSLTMSGTFTVDEDGKANITATDNAGITLELGESGAVLGNGANYFYIAIPAGNYQNLTLTFTATDGAKCVMKNGKVNIDHNTVGRLTLTGKTFCPAGALPGVFSVSATKKVHFSQGNLWADSSNALHFEEAQWKSTPASNGTKDATHVSHFTWSDNVDAAVGNSNSGSNLFCDENHKVSVNGSEAIYYALSTEEWQYLFSYDDHDNDTRRGKHKWATVNSVGGYVIAPNGFDGTLADTYADDAALAAAGNLVFLPAAGHRNGSSVYDAVGCGYYWSSTAIGEYGAYSVYFDGGYVVPDYYGIRNYGCSVRLVTDVKE